MDTPPGTFYAFNKVTHWSRFAYVRSRARKSPMA